MDPDDREESEFRKFIVPMALIKALSEVLKDNDQMKELYLYSNKLGPNEA